MSKSETIFCPGDWMLANGTVFGVDYEFQGLPSHLQASSVSFYGLTETDFYVVVHAVSEDGGLVEIELDPAAQGFLTHLVNGKPLFLKTAASTTTVTGVDRFLQDLLSDWSSYKVPDNPSAGEYESIHYYLAQAESNLTWWSLEYEFHMLEGIVH